MSTKRLEQQIRFVVEIDKLKEVYRQTYLMARSRKENSAEHSWHLALMVLVLSEYADGGDLDIVRVLKMVLIHDLVEIDAGDTLVYDEKVRQEKKAVEMAAAERIFNLLPGDQSGELRALWDEFEARQTPEAKFARALDRVQPILHNYQTRGLAWREHGITAGQVLERNRHVEEGAPELWQLVRRLVAGAVEKGYLSE
jgi:5'-deoxynucleotidase YfbR-like HD superfamily hydrolase